MDGFKGVNDRLGHPEGDHVLRSVARILDATRVSDDCFRIGGDEFAILMPETTPEEAKVAAERTAEQVRGAQLACGAISISFGIAGIAHADPVRLVAAADAALLAAKDRLYGERQRR
jgi:diguanylate cyclase (GGDEF)-like protein